MRHDAHASFRVSSAAGAGRLLPHPSAAAKTTSKAALFPILNSAFLNSQFRISEFSIPDFSILNSQFSSLIPDP